MKLLFRQAQYIILIILLSFELFAANYYVSTTASGSDNASSWANADDLATFNWGAVNAGDVVYIDGGSSGLTYTTQLHPTKSGSAGNHITITRGVDAGHDGIPTFRTSTYQAASFDGAYQTIQYLNFEATTGSTSGLEVIRMDGDNILFQHNTVLAPVQKSIRISGGDNNRILYNTFDTGTSNTSGANTDGIFLNDNGHSVEIAYNSILMRNSDASNGNHKDAIQTSQWQSDGTGLTKIHHNFIYSAEANANANTIFEFTGVAGDWRIYNNVIVYGGTGSGRWLGMNNCGDDVGGNVHSTVVAHNTVYLADASYYIEGLFGYLPDISTDDIAGNPRNGTWDIGAYEFQSGVTDTVPTFSFTALTGRELNTEYIATSAITDVDTVCHFWTTTGAEFKINYNGTYSTAMKTADPDNGADTIYVKNTSSGSYSTLTTETIVGGGNSQNFNVTTKADPSGQQATIGRFSDGKIIRDSTGKIIKVK